MKYKVVLHRSEEGVAASVPGLPGCWSQGQTEPEALENIRSAGGHDASEPGEDERAAADEFVARVLV